MSEAGGRARILIVDDDRDLSLVVQSNLESRGYGVELFSSGADAMERMERIPCDAVLVDFWMPGLNGIETILKIRAVRPFLAIVMMSEMATGALRVAARAAGVNRFLEKPFTADAAARAIDAAIREKRLHAAVAEALEEARENESTFPRYSTDIDI